MVTPSDLEVWHFRKFVYLWSDVQFIDVDIEAPGTDILLRFEE